MTAEESHIKQQGQISLWEAYNMLKGITDAKELETLVGRLITNKQLQKLESYTVLTNVFSLDKRLSYKQKVYLDFYAIIQHYTQNRLSDVAANGVKDAFKSLIGAAFDFAQKLAEAAIETVIPFAALILKPFAKGSLSTLAMKYLKQDRPVFQTYEAFKEGFKVFIGKEKAELGELFEKRYPLYGFEEWLE
ncbi:MAG: hypothetical protein AAGG75_15240 [Bacteroidota bacterium]